MFSNVLSLSIYVHLTKQCRSVWKGSIYGSSSNVFIPLISRQNLKLGRCHLQNCWSIILVALYIRSHFKVWHERCQKNKWSHIHTTRNDVSLQRAFYLQVGKIPQLPKLFFLRVDKICFLIRRNMHETREKNQIVITYRFLNMWESKLSHAKGDVVALDLSALALRLCDSLLFPLFHAMIRNIGYLWFIFKSNESKTNS